MSATRAAVAIAAIVAALALLGAAGSARANGVPVPVDLSYIELSNWGPTDATGAAELLFGEGLVHLSAAGLTTLEGAVYQGWLVNSEVGDAISFGRFNATTSGSVIHQGMLPPIADFGFDLLILTVEPEPDDAPQPSADRSIGGYFTLVGPDGIDGSNESGQVQQPGTLPNTGLGWLPGDVVRLVLLAAVMALSLVVGLRLGRRHA